MYFAHEMTAVPTSLFKDTFMRKIDKSETGRSIKKDLENVISDLATGLPTQSMLVIDGGWLVHVVLWKKHAAYICRVS